MKSKSREGSGLRDGFLFKYCLSCISASVAESGKFFEQNLYHYQIGKFVLRVRHDMIHPTLPCPPQRKLTIPPPSLQTTHTNLRHSLDDHPSPDGANFVGRNDPVFHTRHVK